MPECNTVLQSENDLFEPETQPISHGNCEFLALIRTIKSSKCFGHCPVKDIRLQWSARLHLGAGAAPKSADLATVVPDSLLKVGSGCRILRIFVQKGAGSSRSQS